mmetsp:Transcript_27145/g.63692  ORF Transcript_27145/g.63692 Transcript_27145/m.63692 type:complete len:167 (+) Transcript_27145:25-525(+)
MAVLLPQKPSTPPPSFKAPRRQMLRSTSSASPTQRDAASKPIAAVLVDVPGIPESATSASPSSRMQSQGISDSRECRVHFEDTPEIVLFLSEEDTTEEIPVVEEDWRDQVVEIHLPSPSTPAPPQTGETPRAVPGIPPAPHDLCTGGLADLGAERRAATLRKLFPP